MLLFAFVLYLLFHRRRPLFVEHAVFSMHTFSFILLSSLLMVGAVELRVFRSFVAIGLFILGVGLWHAVYLAFALRRFYWDRDGRRVVPWAQAVGVAVLLYFANSFFLTAVQIVGGAIAIWRL